MASAEALQDTKNLEETNQMSEKHWEDTDQKERLNKRETILNNAAVVFVFF